MWNFSLTRQVQGWTLGRSWPKNSINMTVGKVQIGLHMWRPCISSSTGGSGLFTCSFDDPAIHQERTVCNEKGSKEEPKTARVYYNSLYYINMDSKMQKVVMKKQVELYLKPNPELCVCDAELNFFPLCFRWECSSFGWRVGPTGSDQWGGCFCVFNNCKNLCLCVHYDHWQSKKHSCCHGTWQWVGYILGGKWMVCFDML